MKSFKQFLLEKTEEEMIDNPFFNQHIARLHGAIVNAEHFIAPDKPITDPFAYEENRYIRTTKRPDPGKKASSAYGPGQITRDTARGFYE